MMGHNICFKRVIWRIILKLSLYPFLSGALSSVREEVSVLEEILSFKGRIQFWIGYVVRVSI